MNKERFKRVATPTGNLAVDMVYACLDHYKQLRVKVQYVNLSARYWGLFTEWMKENAPELVFDTYGVQFNNTIIRKGHSFMTENLQVEFYKEVNNATA